MSTGSAVLTIRSANNLTRHLVTGTKADRYRLLICWPVPELGTPVRRGLRAGHDRDASEKNKFAYCGRYSGRTQRRDLPLARI